MSIMFWTALVAFLGYPVAFVYSFRAREKSERVRRALTTISATGLAVVSLIIVQTGVLQDPGCAAIRCLAYEGCAALAFAGSLFLIVLEGTRRSIKR